MLPVQQSYPFFEANQVLSSRHLNDLFSYLDEQERLTRVNLIGIGIVCGLEPTVATNGSMIRVSKGCGITSEGYLIVWENQEELEFCKPYKVPDNIAYPTFLNKTTNQQYPLWELTADRNNDPAAQPLTDEFLTGTNQPSSLDDPKILLLFLECLNEGNKNCSPNSCDDRGATVTATVRPLLMREKDLKALLEKVKNSGPGAEEYFSLGASNSARFNLPEIRLRRFNVEATAVSTTANVFNSFQTIISGSLVDQLAGALGTAYNAFKPLLRSDFPTNPFVNLKNDLAYLHDNSISKQGKSIWLQYYWDHIDTLIQAYDELRDRGMEIMGLCCPDGSLFPRHLMLGKLKPSASDGSYRHHFTPSPILSRLHDKAHEIRTLFARLAELVKALEIPPVSSDAELNIRITPSTLGPYPLSQKAIPYHYKPGSLFKYWDYRKNVQNKAHQILGYRAPEWNKTDDFVLNPLRYDLEPNNFLRIEGHIGKPYAEVMRNLLFLKQIYRLPIEIVAVKTGRSSDDIELPDDLSTCHFQDLEALYRSLREELLCNICEQVMYFYNINIKTNTPVPNKGVPALTILRNCAPDFRIMRGTVGVVYENNIKLLSRLAYPAIIPNAPNPLTITFNLRSSLLQNNAPSSSIYYILYIYYLSKLSETLSSDLSGFELVDFENKYKDLNYLARYYNDNYTRRLLKPSPNATVAQTMPDEEIQDQLTQILYFCKLEPIQAVVAEYKRRQKELRDQLLLHNFARKHPGLQHKAGCPLGGTFVLVYHGADKEVQMIGPFVLRGRLTAGDLPLAGAMVVVVGTSQGTITDNDGLFQLTVKSLPVTIRLAYPGYTTKDIIVRLPDKFIEVSMTAPLDESTTMFSNIAENAVIADFYLPYLCCSDCPPIQFVLPKVPPAFTWQQRGCTVRNADGKLIAPVELNPFGGVGPYEYSTDGGVSWHPLSDETLQISENTRITVRDNSGTLSTPRIITLRAPLEIKVEDPVCADDGETYSLSVTVSGGQTPYRYLVNKEEVAETASVIKLAFPAGQDASIEVEDSSQPACKIQVEIPAPECKQPCILPCDGRTLDCGHLFWLPTPSANDPILAVNLNVTKFSVSGTLADGSNKKKDFTDAELQQLTKILSPPKPEDNFKDTAGFHNDMNIRVATANKYIGSVLGITFGTDPVGILLLGYDPDSLPGFAVLRIQRYECFDFYFSVSSSYKLRSDLKYTREVTYSSTAGTKVYRSHTFDGKEISSTVTLPPFDCVRGNRCLPEFPQETLCKKKFKAKVEIKKTADKTVETGIIAKDVNDNPFELTDNDVIYWEFENGDPALGSEINQKVHLPSSKNRINLIVVRPDSCVASDVYSNNRRR